MMNTLKWLQNWYHENCNGDWEHSYDVKIDTVDNPGWSVEIK
ncbi:MULTISPECIES: Imm53 family immunity protein [Paenibacillus]|uniref:Imm53 family immunity protein n=1 Tax=Paenibacillus amylolyticus TaxID=1451 RepID=A0ABD8AZX9_PAEAM